MGNRPLVSIGLPVRNGAQTLEPAIRSVLAQDYECVELLISDNASTDATEELCRDLAATDRRIRYHRQPVDVGLTDNFTWTRTNAGGTYFRWLGDSDELRPTYVSRCVEVLERDPRLVLVTSQQEYIDAQGVSRTTRYEGTALGSSDPVDRFAEMLWLFTAGYALLDPMYGMFRRDALNRVRYDKLLRGDEIFAAKLALEGPWAHLPDVLSLRRRDTIPPRRLVRLLETPRWHAALWSSIQCRVLWTHVDHAALTPAQRRRAHAAIARLYLRRHARTAAHRAAVIRMRAAEFAGRR